MAISSTLDPYGALGVPNDASPATIRSSYKKLMLQCHPDKVRDEAQRPEKAAQYEKVQQAYELLSDARRRRKYDEELARRGPAAAQASAAAGAAANGTSAGPSTPSAGRAPADEAAKAQKDRERQERHERRRRKHQEEEHRRKSREEGSWNDHDKEARKSYQARHKAEQEETARASTHYDHEHRYKDDTSRPGRAYGSSSSSRYTTDDSPRKPSTYDRTPPPHGAPPTEARVPPQPDAEPVRPGYEETRAAEEAKLEAVRKKTREAQGLGPSTPRTHRSNSREEDPHLKPHTPADYHRQQMRMDEEREKDRSARKARAAAAAKEATQEHLSERMGRPTDIPPSRARKLSSSPLGRHGSSTVSRDDYGTPPYKHMGGPPIFGGSVPTGGAFYPGSPQAAAAHPQVRRRHSVSSPSLEKQTSRLQRDQQTCDSGYSSPSPNTDAPITFEKKHIPSNLNPNPSPMVRNADGSPVHPQGTPGSNNWKKYTFEVYVREDGETDATIPPGVVPGVVPGVASNNVRKTSSAGTGSPSSQPAEPILPDGPPLPSDFFAKTTGIGNNPFYVHSVQSSVDPRTFPVNAGPAYTSSTTSHSSHSSPRQPPSRHQTVHHYPSPKMGEGFPSGMPGVIPGTMPAMPGVIPGAIPNGMPSGMPNGMPNGMSSGMPSPGMSRASTSYTSSARRMDHGQYVTPPFSRGGTWS